MYSRIKIIQLVAIQFLLLTVIVRAQAGISPNNIERAGQSGWQFLKIDGDARVAALGGTFTAIADGDANSMFGNPASLTDVKNINVQVNTLKWVAEITHQSLGVAVNLGGIGVIGANVAILNYGDIPETIYSSAGAAGMEAVITGRMFSANDIAAGLSFARKITDNLSIGVNCRWMQQQIAELSMRNWSLDFGTMYYTGFKSLRIAITARNFGTDSRFGGWSEEYQTESDYVRMPLDIRAGVAMDFFNEDGGPHILTVIAEGDHPNDGVEKFCVGASYAFKGLFFIRGGYKFNYDVQGLTFGVGINYSFGGVDGTLNYAYVDFGELTQVHMFSLGFSF